MLMMPGIVSRKARMAGRIDSSTAAARPLFHDTRTTWVTSVITPGYDQGVAQTGNASAEGSDASAITAWIGQPPGLESFEGLRREWCGPGGPCRLGRGEPPQSRMIGCGFPP